MTVASAFEKPTPGTHAAAVTPPPAAAAPPIVPAAAAAEPHAEGFVYTFRSGEALLLPKFGEVMTFGLGRRLRHLDETEQLFALVEEVCDEAALAVLDKMGAEESAAFFKAWQADSGVTLGESKA